MCYAAYVVMCYAILYIIPHHRQQQKSTTYQSYQPHTTCMHIKTGYLARTEQVVIHHIIIDKSSNSNSNT
jgi:hypothetical protein